MSQETYQGLTEIEQHHISASKDSQDVQNDEGDKQDQVSDLVKKKLKNAQGEPKSLNAQSSSQKDIEINPEKFNGPVQKPKTANKAFGEISDFLLFFENRNPEMKEFVKEFKEIEKLDPEFSIGMLNTVIAPKIDQCLNDMHQKIKAKMKSILNRKDRYSGLFTKKIFKTWEEFYKQVLYAYTINGFLFKKVNKYLRNENWMKLDALIFYTYCLLKAFLWNPTGLSIQENFEALKEKSRNNKLTLYRRADFDEALLNFYDVKKGKNFSWNGVTSTSIVESVTKKFQGDSSKRPILITIDIDFEALQPENFNALYLSKFSAFPNEEEVVLAPGSIFQLLGFNRENPEVEMRLKLVTNARSLAHNGQYMHGMLHTIMRNEDELKFVCLNKKELSRKLSHCKGNTLIKDLEFCFCTFNEKTIEVCKEVFPTIKNLSSLTLNIVNFEENGRLDALLECLEKVKIKKLQILDSLSEKRNVKDAIKSLKYLSSLDYFKLSLEEDCKKDVSLFHGLLEAGCKYLRPECILEIDVGTSYNMISKGLNCNDFLLEKLGLTKARNQTWSPKRVPEIEHPTNNSQMKYLPDTIQKAEEDNSLYDRKSESMGILDWLELEEGRHEIIEIIESSRGIRKYCIKGVERGSSLEALENKFIEALKEKNIHWLIKENENQYSNQQEFKSQDRERIEEFELFTSLCLSFERDKIFDEEIDFLCSHGIQYLQFLKTLQINFDECKEISDKGLAVLSCQGIKKLPSLTSLHLSFDGCSQITDEGLKSLCSEGIKHLSLLTSLHLSFGNCNKITDEGLSILGSEGIQHLPQLTFLDLNFKSCYKITDEGPNSLCLEGIKHRPLLTSLHLSFESCNKVTDEGLRTLAAQGIGCLLLLTSLKLNFRKCYVITGIGFQSLCLEGIKHLSLLTSLYLCFDQYGGPLSKYMASRIANASLKILGSEVIQHLPQLTSLHLSFKNCNQVSDIGLKDLCLGKIKLLTSLHLSFGGGKKITNRSLKILGSKVIKHLSQLTLLHLSFKDCEKITDVGLKSLYMKGIKYLRLLTSLHLNFKNCTKITDNSLRPLESQGIQFLPLLTSLLLNFKNCSEISFEDFDHLCSKGIQHLQLLAFLHLNFDLDINLLHSTPEDFKTLGSELRQHLPFLTKFYLKFGRYNAITDEGFKSLRSEKDFHRAFRDFKRAGRQCSQNPEAYRKILSDFHIYVDSQTFNRSHSDLWISKNPTNLPSSSLQNSLRSNQASIFAVYSTKSGFYLKKHPFKCEQTIPKFLKNQYLFDSKDFHENFCDYNLVKQTQKDYHVKFHLNVEADPIDDDDITDQEGVADDWQGVKTLSLIFNDCQLPSTQRLESYLKTTQYFKSIGKLNLRSNQSGFPLNECCQILFKQRIHDFKCLKSVNFIFPSTSVSERERLNILKASPTLALTLFTQRKVEERKAHFQMSRQNSQGSIPKKKCQKQRLNLSSPSLENISPMISNQNINERDFSNAWESELDLTLNNEKTIFFNFKSLLNLHFHFFESSDMTNEDLKKFSATLSCLEQLQILDLSFYGCRRLTDEGLSSLSSRGLRQLGQLTELSLDFGFCHCITDEGINCLAYEGIGHLKLLTKLDLNFEWCSLISDIGFDHLSCQGIKNLELLTDLRLSFNGCNKMTDFGLNWLASGGIQNLELLTTFSLDTSGCQNISIQGMKSLIYGAISHLQYLTHLDLSFGAGHGIISEDFQCLCQEAIFPLKSLLSLRLDIHIDGGISDKGLECICIEGLQCLEALTSFELISHGENRITEKGIKSLAFKGMSRLISLEHLHISLPQITTVSSSLYEAFNKILMYFGLQESGNFDTSNLV